MANNLVLGPVLTRLIQIWAPKIFFLCFISTRCRKLSLYANSRKTYDPKSIKFEKKTHFGPDLRLLGPNSVHQKIFLKKLALSDVLAKLKTWCLILVFSPILKLLQPDLV